MWIFLNDGFFSIIEDEKNHNQLVVRARKKGDIERVFNVKSKNVVKLPHRDYMYRTCLRKSKVARILTDRILEINYHNFKDSIDKKEHDRKAAYSRVWQQHMQWQNDLHPYEAAEYSWVNYRNHVSRYNGPKHSYADKTAYDVYTGEEIDINNNDDEPVFDRGHQILYPNE